MLTSIKEQIAGPLSKASQLSESEILKALELPKKLEHGHLALPVFALAKERRKAPPLIAQEVAKALADQNLPFVSSVTPIAGFVNISFRDRFLQDQLLAFVSKKSFGHSTDGNGKTVVIDYSSPNVAKPMSIGHMRATVIGQAIRNLAETQGYKVIGINHLGDWGVQFGKLAWAYVNWGKDYDFKENPFDSLFKLYVRFHEEAENDEELEKQGAAWFKRLEDGDPEIRKIWKMFLDITLAEHKKLYDLLGVKHDLIQGEAFYNDHLEPTVERIKKAGILEESQGAQVVFVDEKLPPCIIRKSDGASLYATRDIASAIYRKEVLKGDIIMYVVGIDQQLHFQQVFGVLAKMGLPWAKDCCHISFGMYRFPEGKMSTRRGRVIFMEDVFERAIELVRKVIQEKNPDLPDKETVAQQVGVGAMVFNDLVNDRLRNVDFDWEKALDFSGDSGPYVQYTGVRCKSLIRKHGQPIPAKMSVELSSKEERELIRLLLNFEEVLFSSWRSYKPSTLASYCLDVCRAFSHFYHEHRILDEAPEIAASRMALVQATERVLESGLGVLGIRLPEMM